MDTDLIKDVATRGDRPPFVRFEKRPVEDKAASVKEGHYVARDVDFALITPPYSKDVMIYKVVQWFDILEQDVRNSRIPQVWVDQYKQAYQAWQRGQSLPLNGTPIKGWGVISPAQQEILIRMNVLTVEDMAQMNDEGLRRVGMGAVDLKNKAKAWIAQLESKGPLTMKMAALEGENSTLKSQVETLTRQVAALMTVARVERGEPLPVEEGITASDLLDELAVVEPRPELSLEARYAAKFGKPPHHRMKTATIEAALKE